MSKVRDILYNDYFNLYDLNKKLRRTLPIYFITDYGVVIGKSSIKFAEQFVVLNDDTEFEYLNNVLIDGEVLYDQGREIRKTGFSSKTDGDKYIMTSEPREQKDGSVTTPDNVEIVKYPREEGNAFKNKFYYYLNRMDLFRLRGLHFIDLTEDEKIRYADQCDVQLDVDGYKLIIDNSLFPGFNKPNYIPDLSVAVIPDELVRNEDEDLKYFLLRHIDEAYTIYMLLRANII